MCMAMRNSSNFKKFPQSLLPATDNGFQIVSAVPEEVLGSHSRRGIKYLHYKIGQDDVHRDAGLLRINEQLVTVLVICSQFYDITNSHSAISKDEHDCSQS